MDEEESRLKTALNGGKKLDTSQSSMKKRGTTGKSKKDPFLQDIPGFDDEESIERDYSPGFDYEAGQAFQ